ncbi:glycosyltransferase [Qipengyuania sp. NPDC077563]|uniref:glycosyltransferase n=1 Tax=Qipengyuania sp. NPDC077563 TaxID=3364497 RepID=UPI00384F2541
MASDPSSFIRLGAFILPSDRLGGAERVTCTLVRTLLDEGILTEAIIFIMAKRSEDAQHLIEFLEDDRVRIFYGGRRELFGILPLLLFFIGRRFCLVFSSFTHVNALVSFARKMGILRTKRLVTRESTLIFERKFAGWKHKVFPWLYRFYGGQDLLIMQTEHMRASLIAHRPNLKALPIKVVPNPVTLPTDFRDSSIRQKDHLVWCGRLVEIKRPDLAIRLIQRLPQNFVLHIVGDGPLRGQLQEMVRRFHLEGRVKFHGFADHPGSVFKEMEYGLLTSSVEGFPNVVLEMLAYGVKGVAVTPCTTGLNELAGVFVAKSHRVEDLESVFYDMLAARHSPERVSRLLNERSPQSFASVVAGEMKK